MADMLEASLDDVLPLMEKCSIAEALLTIYRRHVTGLSVDGDISLVQLLSRLGVSDPDAGTPLAVGGLWMTIFLRWQDQAYQLPYDVVEWLAGDDRPSNRLPNLFLGVKKNAIDEIRPMELSYNEGYKTWLDRTPGQLHSMVEVDGERYSYNLGLLFAATAKAERSREDAHDLELCLIVAQNMSKSLRGRSITDVLPEFKAADLYMFEFTLRGLLKEITKLPLPQCNFDATGYEGSNTSQPSVSQYSSLAKRYLTSAADLSDDTQTEFPSSSPFLSGISLSAELDAATVRSVTERIKDICGSDLELDALEKHDLEIYFKEIQCLLHWNESLRSEYPVIGGEHRSSLSQCHYLLKLRLKIIGEGISSDDRAYLPDKTISREYSENSEAYLQRYFNLDIKRGQQKAYLSEFLQYRNASAAAKLGIKLPMLSWPQAMDTRTKCATGIYLSKLLVTGELGGSADHLRRAALEGDLALAAGGDSAKPDFLMSGLLDFLSKLEQGKKVCSVPPLHCYHWAVTTNNLIGSQYQMLEKDMSRLPVKLNSSALLAKAVCDVFIDIGKNSQPEI
ncbi:Hypothetical protein D9617_118g092460 [Elsinoe fawcettii]|nr:Hypothetical protein D9617_118g092460 [Elsinoe fawcettii]